MNTIAVLDYGMGNLHSVSKALQKVSTKENILITNDHKKILSSNKLVVPGVGAIRGCMNSLINFGFDDLIKEYVQSKPILGICVGMQLFFERSEENQGTECLGVIKGSLEKIPTTGDIKVPHMGWNKVNQLSKHPIWKDIENHSFFYFVHSYAAFSCSQVDSETCHGKKFASSIAKENLFAVQFHPEKSQLNGLKLYKNFLEWEGGVS